MSSSLNLTWCRCVVATLQSFGVRHWFLAPGARSAPLAYAASWQAGLEIITHYDERGAAFAALGAARAGGRPAVCLTTSGTAAAHLLPAVIEAKESGTPLVVVTADRPATLRGSGANQTILQPGLFGKQVRAEWDLPLPGEHELSWLEEHLRKVLHPLEDRWPGPVHLNVPLAEPLLPEDCKVVSGTKELNKPDTKKKQKILSASSKEYELREIGKNKNGVLVVGELSLAEQGLADELAGLAGHLGWPLLADPLSGMRRGVTGVIHHTDLLLQDVDWPVPSVILHVGGRVVSRRLQEWMARVAGSAQVQIRRGPERLDPGLVEPQFLAGEIGDWVGYLVREIPAAWHSDWREQWMRADAAAAEYLQKVVTWPGEPALAREAFALAGEFGGAVFLGNSMPIRDVDAFVDSAGSDLRVPVFGQRGASGIDGNLAHMAGIARCLDRPLFGLVGDLAVLHDLNSCPLLAGRRIMVLVPNNSGGGIFSFLPMHLPKADRERLMATPHGFCLSLLVAPFGVRSRRCSSLEEVREFVSELLDPAHPPGPGLVEIPVDRQENLAQHQEITHGWLAQAARWRPARGQ